ncbi:MAG: hypothetical protein ACI9IT_002610 [Glaciecola sp.]
MNQHGWSEGLTAKHTQKMSTGIQNLGNYLKQLGHAK